jgi:hypothetical protein
MTSIVFITRAGEIDSDPFDPAALRAAMLAATSWDEEHADSRRTKLTWHRPGLSAIVELPRKATNGILPPHITITLRSGSRATLAADYREFMLAMHGVAEQLGGGLWDEEGGRTLTAEYVERQAADSQIPWRPPLRYHDLKIYSGNPDEPDPIEHAAARAAVLDVLSFDIDRGFELADHRDGVSLMVLLFHDDDGLQDDIGIMIVVRDHLQWRARYRTVLFGLQAIAARLGGGLIDLEQGRALTPDDLEALVAS